MESSLIEKQQMDINLKMQKIFDTCKLEGSWKQKGDVSDDYEYIAQEDGACIMLSLINAPLTETFCFKKDAKISVTKSLVSYYEKDLLDKTYS